MEFELIQIEQVYFNTNNIFISRRTLFVIGRSITNNNKYIFFINDFYPRFLVEKDENLDLIVGIHKDKIYKIKNDNKYITLGKKTLVRIYTYITSQVVDLRELFSKTYEANIRFTEVFKRKKMIKSHYEISNSIVNDKSRIVKLSGINYRYLTKKEIKGTRYDFSLEN